MNPFIRHLPVLIFLASAACSHTSKPTTANDQYFTYDGKKYALNDLPTATQQRVYVSEKDLYDLKQKLITDEVMRLYIEDLAKVSGKTPSQIKDELFPKKKLDAKQKREFYEKHKDQIPYAYEIIEPEIDTYVQEITENESRQMLIKQIVEKKNARLLFEPPVAPKIALTTDPFPHFGDPAAKVHIVEFGDFTCPICKIASAPVRELMEKYKGKVFLTFKFFHVHPGGTSERMAVAAQCAFQLGKFPEFYDYVFKNQLEVMWMNLDKLAQNVGLDPTALKTCADKPETKDLVAASHGEGVKFGVDATPAFFVNGKLASSGGDVTKLERAIVEEL